MCHQRRVDKNITLRWPHDQKTGISTTKDQNSGDGVNSVVPVVPHRMPRAQDIELWK
jgi:hypothetical protein